MTPICNTGIQTQTNINTQKTVMKLHKHTQQHTNKNSNEVTQTHANTPEYMHKPQ